MTSLADELQQQFRFSTLRGRVWEGAGMLLPGCGWGGLTKGLMLSSLGQLNGCNKRCAPSLMASAPRHNSSCFGDHGTHMLCCYSHADACMYLT